MIEFVIANVPGAGRSSTPSICWQLTAKSSTQNTAACCGGCTEKTAIQDSGPEHRSSASPAARTSFVLGAEDHVHAALDVVERGQLILLLPCRGRVRPECFGAFDVGDV